jgi:hypothetical protein
VDDLKLDPLQEVITFNGLCHMQDRKLVQWIMGDPLATRTGWCGNRRYSIVSDIVIPIQPERERGRRGRFDLHSLNYDQCYLAFLYCQASSATLWAAVGTITYRRQHRCIFRTWVPVDRRSFLAYKGPF